MRVIKQLKAVRWIFISAITCLVLLIALPRPSYSFSPDQAAAYAAAAQQAINGLRSEFGQVKR